MGTIKVTEQINPRRRCLCGLSWRRGNLHAARLIQAELCLQALRDALKGTSTEVRLGKWYP